MSIWEDKEQLATLDLVRNAKRIDYKRLPFDCCHLKTDGVRAYCSKGFELKEKLIVPVISVLKGVVFDVCKQCSYFETD